MPFLHSFNDAIGVPGTREQGAPMVAQVEPCFGSYSDAVASLTAIWTTEHDRLFRFAFGMTRNVADADDCVSQAYINVLGHWDKIRDAAGALFSATRNLALMVIRARKETVDPDTIALIDSNDPGSVRDLTNATLAWLREIATDREWSIINAWVDWDGKIGFPLNSETAVAKHLGLGVSTVSEALERLRLRVGVAKVGQGKARALAARSGAIGQGYGWRITSVWSLCAMLLAPLPEPKSAVERVKRMGKVAHVTTTVPRVIECGNEPKVLDANTLAFESEWLIANAGRLFELLVAEHTGKVNHV